MGNVKLALQVVINELSQREVCQTGEVIEWIKDVQRIVEEEDYKGREEVKENMYKLREEYFVIAGKKPYLGWPESVLEQKVAELKQKNTIDGASLRNKKAEWNK